MIDAVPSRSNMARIASFEYVHQSSSGANVWEREEVRERITFFRTYPDFHRLQDLVENSQKERDILDTFGFS